MKKKSAFTLWLVCSTLVWIQPVSADLIGWWPFEDGSGSIAKDASDSNVEALLLGDPVWGQDGQHGDALLLDGDGDFAHAESSYSLPLYSVGMWFRVDGGSAERDLLGIYADELTFGILLEVRSDGVLRYLHRPDSGADINIYTDTAYDDGSWHHIAAVKSSDEMVLYMDGEIVGSAANSTVLPDPMNRLVMGVLDHGRNLRFFPGPIDEVFVYNHPLSAQDVQAVMDGRGPGMNAERAGNLYPEDDSADVPRDVVLEWIPGEFAATHNVYLALSFDAVNTASTDEPKGVLVGPGQDTNTLDAGVLAFGQTYYWRVDEVNDAPDTTVFQGPVWSFTVEPKAIAALAAATASSFSDPQEPNNTVNGAGLNDADEHGTGQETMWLSDAGDAAPWIQFELDSLERLDRIHVWNHNTQTEGILGFGIQEALIETSLDGETWTDLKTVVLPQASGLDTYAGADLALDGVVARFMRINPQSNYSLLGLSQFGLSEVRFYHIPNRARESHPADGSTADGVDVTLSWRAGREAVAHEVYLGADSANLALVDTVSASTYLAEALDYASTYYWQVVEVNEAETPAQYEGEILSFSTPAVGVIDDMESYKNEEFLEPWATWIDGFEDDSNGSVVGANPLLGDYGPETVIVHSGSKSLPIHYDNTTAPLSEATLSFADSQDWTQSGIKGLRLAFHGDPANTATQMYIKINGTPVDYDGDAVTIQQKPWHTWYVDLANLVGVNLESVTELTIGFKGGKGVVYVDDIVLTPSDRERVMPVEPSAANLVVHYAFAGDAADSTSVHSGTMEGIPSFVPGKTGQAIKLDGLDDYVTVEGSFDLATYTAGLWFRVEGGTGPRDIISIYDSSGAFGVLLELQGSGTLRYLKRPLGTSGDKNIYTATTFDDGAWYYVTIVKSADAITMFVNGESAGSTADATAYDDGALRRITLGVLKHDNLIRYFPGELDEFSLYNRVLSQDEIAGLAGRTLPYDK